MLKIEEPKVRTNEGFSKGGGIKNTLFLFYPLFQLNFSKMRRKIFTLSSTSTIKIYQTP